MYKESLANNTLGQFYQNMNCILKLKMYKMQLLDHQHLLIKYVNLENMVTQKHLVTIASRPIVLHTNAADYHSYTQIGAVATITASLNPNGSEGRDNTSEVINSGVAIIANEHGSNTTANNASSTSNTTSSTNIRVAIRTPPSSGVVRSSSSVRPPNASIVQNQVAAMTAAAATPNSRAQSPNGGEAMATLPVIMNENTVPFYFVLYDMRNARILNVLRNTSSHLLSVYENFQDYFSMSIMDGTTSASSSLTPSSISSFNFHTLPSNNTHANQTLKRHVKNILRLNSASDMTKCLLAHLPISSQSYTVSPYLDHSLFSYDEKMVSNLERPKPIGDQVIKFNMRESGRMCFRMFTGMQSNVNAPVLYPNKRLVAFIWHPREPFCISVQRANSEYTVNFHVYSKINLN
jgi:hypothetical protein